MNASSIATFIFGAAATWLLFFKLPVIGRGRKEQPSSNKNVVYLSVSVIIPARNEEHNLPNILGDLMRQSYPIHEIICVDDGSTDGTALVIERFAEKGIKKVRRIGVENPGKGWKGKTWACQSGAAAADGELLLFVDADVRMSDGGVEALVERYLETGRNLSVQPYHAMKKFYEYLSLFFNLIQTCATGLSVAGIKRTEGFYGPVLLIERRVFKKHGGYEKVRNKVIEDFDLGKYLASKGVLIDLYLGGREVRFRMYPLSAGDLIEGWSKNFASGSFSMRPWLMIAIVWWIGFLNIVPYYSITAVLSGNNTLIVPFVAIYCLVAAMLYRTASRLGSYPFLVCLFYPFYLLVFQLVYVRSIIKTYIFRNTTWKGRKL